MGHTAVFLMNLGGPRSLEEVEPYLYELFSDPLVVTAPFGPLRPLFAKIVSKTRAPSSAEKYALIGGRSPIVEGTEAQARALAAALGGGWTCHLAMRCGHPNTEEGVREALAVGAGGERLAHALLGVRVPAAHREVARPAASERGGEGAGLRLRPLHDRRPAADERVLLGGRGRSRLRDDLREERPERPERRGDDERVGEELVEVRLDLLERARPAEVHEEDGGVAHGPPEGGRRLHGPRELGARRALLEIRVEEHRDIADEELPERSDAQELPVEGHEPVVLQLLHPSAQVLLDRVSRSLPELLLDLAEVEPEQAHDPVDDEPAHHVVVAHRGAALDRDDPGIHLLAPLLQLVEVLDVGAADVRDGADPERHGVGRRTDRVALEVPVQVPAVLRLRELVRLEGEVVEADEPVARLRERLHRGEEELHALLGLGERLLREQALVRLRPGDVREAEHGEPVRVDRDDPREGVLPGLGRLVRQAVDEIEVHAVEAARARGGHEVRGLLLALDPPDDLLDLRVEVLDAHRDPVEPELRERLDLRPRRDGGIDLDRLLDVLREREVAREDLVTARELLLVEEGGRAAAPVELRRLAAVRQLRGDERNLLLELVEVGVGA